MAVKGVKVRIGRGNDKEADDGRRWVCGKEGLAMGEAVKGLSFTLWIREQYT